MCFAGFCQRGAGVTGKAGRGIQRYGFSTDGRGYSTGHSDAVAWLQGDTDRVGSVAMRVVGRERKHNRACARRGVRAEAGVVISKQMAGAGGHGFICGYPFNTRPGTVAVTQSQNHKTPNLSLFLRPPPSSLLPHPRE